ncbi:hypothetical protein [Mucilaginibacter sp.]|jgi:hypothetical protein|uniref:hypothetical protein n=1 Tax=Mucilaginibacter sp. TaxID=1882438 RepID=UPI002601657B|nr:hypothetical protein [Mucilaginibacter sp.]MDB4918852.1 hypothetical protein [Mucilaginibacter sp.]
MKTISKKPGEHKAMSKHDNAHEHLRTDSPLSEKDEVKQAEEKMRRTRRKML